MRNRVAARIRSAAGEADVKFSGMNQKLRSTTILAVRRDGRTAMGGDGQVTLGETALKHGARKVRPLSGGSVLAGFAGAAADSFALLERFEAKLESHSGDMVRAAVELAREWRTDRLLRRLESILVVADATKSLVISGSGDVIEPDDGVIGIGSGGGYATAAGRALLLHSQLSAEEIVREALRITAGICIYTNDHIHIEVLP